MSANNIAPPDTNPNYEGRHNRDYTGHRRAHEAKHALPDMSGERRANFNHLAPIIDHLTEDNLFQLDTLNDEAEKAYADTLAKAENAGYNWYVAQGMSQAEALKRVEEETRSRQYQNRMKRDVLIKQGPQIEALLPDFIGHLDASNPDDPDYLRHVDEIRESLYQVAGMPRREWEGDRDEQTDEPARNGVFHDIARYYNPDYDKLFNTYDKDGKALGQATGPNQPVGHVPVPNAPVTAPASPNNAPVTAPPLGPFPPNPGNPQNPNGNPNNLNNPNVQPQSVNERRPSVTNERYGAQVGQTFSLKQERPDGSYVIINYKIMGFPKRQPGEEHDPANLQRVEETFDKDGKPIGQPVESEYTLATEHLEHLGQDVAESNPASGPEPIDLKQYWEEIIPKREGAADADREKAERRRKFGRRLFGILALAGTFGAGYAAHRYQADVAHALQQLRDFFQGFGTGGTSRHLTELATSAPSPADATPTPDVIHYSADAFNISSGEGMYSTIAQATGINDPHQLREILNDVGPALANKGALYADNSDKIGGWGINKNYNGGHWTREDLDLIRAAATQHGWLS